MEGSGIDPVPASFAAGDGRAFASLYDRFGHAPYAGRQRAPEQTECIKSEERIMGYVLLWVENLTVLLLTVALVTACVGRLQRRWLRYGLWTIASVAILLPLGLVTLFWWSAVFQHQTWAIKWFAAMLALTISFAAGSLWLRVRGLRRVANVPAPTAAGDWPRGKLATFLAVAVALHLMTIWNLDLGARQQLETLRVEAGQLGQSVAPQPVSDRDNAAILYEQASEAMGPEAKWPEVFTDWASRGKNQEGQSDQPLSPQLRKVLDDWRPVVALLHEAASKPGYYVDREYYRPTTYMQVSDINTMRHMAGLLALDGLEKAATGDMHGAIQDINTRLVMARHVATEPLVITGLVSAVLEENALSTLQGLLQRKKVSAADLATLRIESGPSYRKLLGRALRFEEASWMTAFCEVGNGQLSRILCEGRTPPEGHEALDGGLCSRLPHVPVASRSGAFPAFFARDGGGGEEALPRGEATVAAVRNPGSIEWRRVRVTGFARTGGGLLRRKCDAR